MKNFNRLVGSSAKKELAGAVGNLGLTIISLCLLSRAASNCHRTSLATVTPFRAFQVLMSCGEVKRRKKELREIPLIPKPPS